MSVFRFTSPVLKSASTSTRPRLAALRASLANPDLPDELTIHHHSSSSIASKTTSNTTSNTTSSIIPYQNFLHPPPSISQPLTDSHSRLHNYIRLSLTSRCNLRCTYCMPEDGVPLPPPPSLLTDTERYKIIKTMSDRSPTPLKIKLTGGEPLLHPTITSLLSDLSTLTPSIGITTNGVLLSRHWPSVSRYISSVNVSLDTVNPEKFNLLTRRKGLNRVMDAVKLASESHRVKVNCVVMRGFNDGVEDFEGILKFCEEAGVECRFIEWMPFSGNNFDGKFVSMSEMKSKIALTGRSITPVETFKTDTTKWVETEGGKVGFISSMSENFCEGCNRVRITCDGNLKVCLFDGTEVSLRDALRAGVSDTELGWIMDNALGRKHFKFAGAEDMHQLAERVKGNRPMTAIGG